MSSIGSCASSIVSFRGEEVELEKVLDDLYVDIQQNLNNSQCCVREMSTLLENDNDYLESLKIHHAVCDYVDVLSELFKELKDVSKQVLGRPPKELKDKVKEINEKRKEEKLKQKEEEKKQKEEEKNLERKMEQLDIIKE